jgi:CRISPR-associated protein Csb1
MSELTKFDQWLTTDEVAALTAQQLLEPVEPGGVVFPPTFAAEDEGEKGGYNIDLFGGGYKATIDYAPTKEGTIKTDISHETGRNVCLIDSVGAEANRIEPLFKPEKCQGRYAGLVPQVIISAGTRKINLLDAGHRAGDAIIRFTKFGERVFEGFEALNLTNNAEPLAKCAPTSLIFGVWDSRGTQEKVPRAFRSVIRAYNVIPLTRSAQYNRATKYVEYGLVPEELDKGSGDSNPLSREGFKDNPATGSHGGVLVGGDIRRDMTINLSAIRRLRVPLDGDPTKDDTVRTLKLRRYILGLALIAATARSEDKYNLREGCQLKQKSGHKPVWRAVKYEGDDTDLTGFTEEAAAVYATLAAEAFGIEKFPEFEFDQKTAEKWLKLDKKQQDKLRRDKPMTQQFADDATGDGAEAPKGKAAKPKGGK